MAKNTKKVINNCTVESKLSLHYLKNLQGELKTLSDENYKKLKASILKHGIFVPFFIWENPEDAQIYMIDGHMRALALSKMKDEGYSVPELPVVFIEATDIKDAKEKLVSVTSQYGEFNAQGFKDFAIDLDMSSIADFSAIPTFQSFIIENENQESIEVSAHTREIGKPKYIEGEDEVPDVKCSTIKQGDVFELGSHRLMCGDSKVDSCVRDLMSGNLSDMIFTDPPYGVSYTGGHNKKKREMIKDDDLKGNDLSDLFQESILNAINYSKDSSAFYIWYASGKSIETFSGIENLPLTLRAVICWYKVQSGLGAFMSQYIPNYEPCMYLFKNGKSPKWRGPTDEKTVWELKRDSKNEYHPTQKPVGLAERAIINSSDAGDIVLDLFGGSGSTLIACEKTDRSCFMMEFDPIYVATIIERWEKFSGKTAYRLNSDGSRVSYNDIKNVKVRKK